MRTHRVFASLQPWSSRTETLRDVVRAENLAVARIEPVTRGREPAAIVDLHFRDGERSVTIPLVFVDLAQFDLRELDPLVFPHAAAEAISDAQAASVVERLLPDLERRALTGGFWSEETIVYGDDALFAAARAAGLFGAAPLTRSLPAIAPAVYARRFAVGKHVATYGPQAHELAAFVRGVATSCGVLAAADGGAAAAWYGPSPAAASGAAVDLAIGTGPAPFSAPAVVRTDDPAELGAFAAVAACPLPVDLMLSFDPADGPVATRFWIPAAREPFVRAVPDLTPVRTGGSSGRIAIVVRPDAALVPDADTDEAAALAAGLAAEGFSAGLVSGVDALDEFRPDLVHLIGVRPGAAARAIAEWTSRKRVPLVLHAHYETPADGGYWGATVAPYCFGYSGDERSVTTYLEMLARRAVEVDGIGPNAPYAPPAAGIEDAERVITLADVVLVNSERERVAVDRLRPRRPTFVVAPLPVGTAAPGPIAARTGPDPFVLVHAPIAPESNSLILARAAAAVGVPFVFAGVVADPIYAERLREFAPSNAVLIAEPEPAAAAALYRAASVVADAAWLARGHSRLLSAAACGAAVVHSQRRWLDIPGAGTWSVDPADAVSVARGIGEAWDAALQRDGDRLTAMQATARFARERLGTACAAIVASYAKIVQTV